MSLTLQAATDQDSHFIWLVNNAPLTRAQSINSEPIPWASHEAWFASKLEDPTCKMWVALTHNERVGVIRFQLSGREALVSVALDEAQQGRGLGRRLIAEATALVFAETPVAVAMIRPDNVGSIRAFEAAGYLLARSETQGDVSLLRYEARRTT